MSEEARPVPITGNGTNHLGLSSQWECRRRVVDLVGLQGNRGVGSMELSARRDFSSGLGVRKCGFRFCPELAV